MLRGNLGTLHTLLVTPHPYFGDIGGVQVDGLALRLGAAIFGDPAHSFDPNAYSLQWLPRGGLRPGYFLDAILNRRFDLVFLFEDDGNSPLWGGGKYEDDFVWKLNETVRAKYDPAPPSPAVTSALAAKADLFPYYSPGAYVRRPGPDPAPWLARCFGPFQLGGRTWSIGRGGGFWCRTSTRSRVLRLVRTRAPIGDPDRRLPRRPGRPTRDPAPAQRGGRGAVGSLADASAPASRQTGGGRTAKWSEWTA